MKTFEDFLMDKFPFHLNNSNEAFEKWLSDIDIDALISYADEYKNKSLTDYHNHIVEKFKEKYKFSSPTTLFQILSLLQDTNPKDCI